MNNKLRQKILKELNFLLSEAEASATAGMVAAQIESEAVRKIVQADIDNDDGFNYINLTDLGVMVNEGDLVKFINVYKDADINGLDADETQAIKKVCTTNIILVDEFGSIDPYFFVKCQNGKPFKALRIGYEGNEANFAPTIQKYRTGAEVAPPTPGPSPQPKPDTGGGGTAFGKSFQCKPGTVAQFQNWLKKQGQAVCADDKFGQKTFAAAKALGNAKLDFSMYNSLDDFKDQAKKDQLCNAIAGDSRWRSESSTPEVCGRGGGGGKRKTSADTKLIPGLKPRTTVDIEAQIKTAEEAKTGNPQEDDVLNKRIEGLKKELEVAKASAVAPQVKESKNFYDNKKLIEAKSLFNKLTKSLI